MNKAHPHRLTSVACIGLFVLGACAGSVDRKDQAERFVRGVYGCDPSVVDELAADSIVLSYPAVSARGRDAVREFAEGFCSRWEDRHFVLHDRIADGDNVVLVWSFSGRYVGPERPQAPTPGEETAWGGITLYRFDAAGKIAAEIGEESTPGPMARVEQ